MSEIVKETLSEQELTGVSGGNSGNNEVFPWTPNKCKGQVTGKTIRGIYECYVYVIGYGDTLSQIALSLTYDGSYTKLAAFNKIANPDKIQAGATIYCPIGSYSV